MAQHTAHCFNRFMGGASLDSDDADADEDALLDNDDPSQMKTKKHNISKQDKTETQTTNQSNKLKQQRCRQSFSNGFNKPFLWLRHAYDCTCMSCPPHGLVEDYELAFSPHEAQPHTGTPASPGPGDASFLRPTLVLANISICKWALRALGTTHPLVRGLAVITLDL